MPRDYGWTGHIRHGLWQCKCRHWNYYRTGTLRIDSACRRQGCDYRARVVLDRSNSNRGRARQVIITEYPPYRPPRSILQEQRERNRFERRNKEIGDRLKHQTDLGVFMTAGEFQEVIDRHDLERHGGTFRLEPHPAGKRSPTSGGSRWKYQRAKNPKNDPQE